jgi:hypothetical protein
MATKTPSSLFKRDVRLLTWARRAQRDAERPQKGDTRPVSTQHVKVVILYERSSCHKIQELDQMYGLS